METNGWRARLLMAVILWAAPFAHRHLFASVTNTPEGMLIYHGSAALIDYLAIMCAANLLAGGLSDDLQAMSLVSMVVNFVGWIAYLAYASPISYNIMILVLGYGQFARLLFLDWPYGDNLDRCAVLRRRNYVGAGLSYQAEKQ